MRDGECRRRPSAATRGRSQRHVHFKHDRSGFSLFRLIEFEGLLGCLAVMNNSADRLDHADHRYRFDDHGPKYLQRGPRSDIGVVTLQLGQHFATHKHSVIEENFLTIEGEVHMYVNGELHRLGVGDFLRCDPGEAHYVVNRGATPWKAVFIKAPYNPTDAPPIEWEPGDDTAVFATI